MDGNILGGDLPSKKLRMLLVWVDMRQEELKRNWELLVSGKKYFGIEPLR